MRKIFIIILLLLTIPHTVLAEEKIEVKFYKCVDGDTAKFIMNDKQISVRFLAIDTPETSHPTKGEEPYGKEAKEFTCNKIENAKKIELEFDKNSDKKDKYNRYLAWVFVDDYLLQTELIKNGLAEVAYLYGDYKYTHILKEYEVKAKLDKVGIYSDTDTSYYTSKKKKEDKTDVKLSEKDKKKIINTVLNSIKKFISSILEEII